VARFNVGFGVFSVLGHYNEVVWFVTKR